MKYLVALFFCLSASASTLTMTNLNSLGQPDTNLVYSVQASTNTPTLNGGQVTTIGFPTIWQPSTNGVVSIYQTVGNYLIYGPTLGEGLLFQFRDSTTNATAIPLSGFNTYQITTVYINTNMSSGGNVNFLNSPTVNWALSGGSNVAQAVTISGTLNAAQLTGTVPISTLPKTGSTNLILVTHASGGSQGYLTNGLIMYAGPTYTNLVQIPAVYSDPTFILADVTHIHYGNTFYLAYLAVNSPFLGIATSPDDYSWTFYGYMSFTNEFGTRLGTNCENGPKWMVDSTNGLDLIITAGTNLAVNFNVYEMHVNPSDPTNYWTFQKVVLSQDTNQNDEAIDASWWYFPERGAYPYYLITAQGNEYNTTNPFGNWNLQENITTNAGASTACTVIVRDGTNYDLSWVIANLAQYTTSPDLTNWTPFVNTPNGGYAPNGCIGISDGTIIQEYRAFTQPNPAWSGTNWTGGFSGNFFGNASGLTGYASTNLSGGTNYALKVGFGVVNATNFNGNGSGLTNLTGISWTALTFPGWFFVSGSPNSTLSLGNISRSLFSYDTNGNETVYSNLTAAAFFGSGASLTALNASALASGTVALPRLGTNTPSVGSFFRSPDGIYGEWSLNALWFGSQLWLSNSAAGGIAALDITPGTNTTVSLIGASGVNAGITLNTNGNVGIVGTLNGLGSGLTNASGQNYLATGGNGSGLTSLNASQLTSGIVPAAALGLPNLVTNSASTAFVVAGTPGQSSMSTNAIVVTSAGVSSIITSNAVVSGTFTAAVDGSVFTASTATNVSLLNVALKVRATPGTVTNWFQVGTNAPAFYVDSNGVTTAGTLSIPNGGGISSPGNIGIFLGSSSTISISRGVTLNGSGITGCPGILTGVITSTNGISTTVTNSAYVNPYTISASVTTFVTNQLGRNAYFLFDNAASGVTGVGICATNGGVNSAFVLLSAPSATASVSLPIINGGTLSFTNGITQITGRLLPF